jgi:hypothetical protein
MVAVFPRALTRPTLTRRTLTRRTASRATCAALGAALAIPLTAGAAQATSSAGSKSTGPKVGVVVRGLNNPRELAWLPGTGALLVAEAGRGGPNCSGTGENETCIGATGSISAVAHPSTASKTSPHRIVTGLVSAGGPDGSFAVGSDGVAALSPSFILIQETYAPPQAVPPGVPGAQLGHLLLAKANGAAKPVVDISAYENKDPDHQGFDSDPYAVIIDGDRALVADAAGNDVLSVDRHGHISTFAVFANITTGACAGRPNDAGTTGCDAVPDALAIGPNGDIYVGGLGGEAPGAGRVWELDKRTGKIVKTWRNLTTVTGVAVAHDGTLYVSELGGGPTGSGDVVRIKANGSRVSVSVPAPAGLLLAPLGKQLYVSVYSTSPAGGLGSGPGSSGSTDTSGQVWRASF